MPTGRLHSPGHTYDHAFGNGDDNGTVYSVVVRPLVELAGRHGGVATVLAFGQTGSGKTYTQTYMQTRACEEMFALKPPEATVYISFFENCGSRVFDLLNVSAVNFLLNLEILTFGVQYWKWIWN